jgi:hypothetical protein
MFDGTQRSIMEREQVERKIEAELKKSKNRVVNRNALQALFGAYADPVSALGKIFLGRQDALDAERARIAQDIVLALLCKIDDVLTNAYTQANQAGLAWTIVSGRIEVHGEQTTNVVGVEISESAGPVELKPGTHISANAKGANTVVGLKVGNQSKKKEV